MWNRILSPSLTASVLVLAAAGSTACGGHETVDARPEAGTEVSPLGGASTSVIRFAAVFGDQPFACGATFEGVGVGASVFTPSDLRFYIHGIELIHPDGSSEPAQLVQDGLWQQGNLALLDFEDRTGPCRNGTPDTRDRVEIAAPSAPFVGLRFSVGVPFELNHQNQALAASPLNLSTMFWSWSAGYKFLRLEGRTGDQLGFRVHVGSVGCVADMNGSIVSCSAPNRPRVEIPSFDPSTQRVVFDLAALLSGSDLRRDAPGASGCMGQPDELGCVPVFERLGLDRTGAATSAPGVFRAAP